MSWSGEGPTKGELMARVAELERRVLELQAEGHDGKCHNDFTPLVAARLRANCDRFIECLLKNKGDEAAAVAEYKAGGGAG